jgi:hypothetical protein
MARAEPTTAKDDRYGLSRASFLARPDFLIRCRIEILRCSYRIAAYNPEGSEPREARPVACVAMKVNLYTYDAQVVAVATSGAPLCQYDMLHLAPRNQ